MQTFNTIVNALGALLIPVVLLFLGQWFLKSKERNDAAIRDADQLATFLEHLSSDNRERRKLALLALTHMQNAGLFPASLLQAVESIASIDDPEIAAAAHCALGSTTPLNTLSADERALLFEVLLPLKIHFNRTKDTFKLWVRETPSKPNIEIEDKIKESNSLIQRILTTKWHLIPKDLQNDALRLIEHYEAWSEEYVRLRPGGIRNPDVPYVFVGPKGVPFPTDAEQKFLAHYEKLVTGNNHITSGG